MIEVPGYLADELEKKAATKKEDVSHETTSKDTVEDAYVAAGERVLDPAKVDGSLLDRMPKSYGLANSHPTLSRPLPNGGRNIHS